MNRTQYRAYLRSPHWQDFRLRYWRTYRYSCVICGASRQLELHHLTYARLGRELDTDVCYLCRRHHQAVTDGYFEIRKVRFVGPPKRAGKNRLFGLF